MNYALHRRDETEAEHADREPDMRFETFENDVGGDLEEDVGDKKDGKCSVVLVSDQAQFLYQAEDGCVGNVGPVEECPKVAQSLYCPEELRKLTRGTSQRVLV